ncbi:MAG: ABC transporter permease [Rhodospirillales bacterium]
MTSDRPLLVTGALYGSLAYLFLFSPVLVLLLFSFQDGQLPIPPLKGLTLRWYAQVLADRQIMTALANSLLVAFSSAGLACLMGFLAAYGLARYRLPWRGGLGWLILAPATISYLIIAMGLMVTFGAVGLPRSLFSVIVGHVVINLPIAFALIYSQLGAHQLNIERAARDLGAGEVSLLLLIVVPSLLPALVAAFALCFSLSWDEFIIAFLLSQFEVTLPVEIWSSLRSGLNPAINAAGTLVFGLSLGLFLLALTFVLARRGLRND